MQVVVIAARKGGSGKTTLAAHLAVEADRAGAGPITLVDMDPQQSLTAWWNDRNADSPRLLELNQDKLRNEVLKAKPLTGLLIVDTPPLDTGAINTIMEIADLVIIPVKPSPHDLRGVGITVGLARKLHKRFVFVINQAIQRTALTQQAPLVLSQFGPVATAIVHHRVDFAGAMTDGRTLQEVEPKSKGAIEIAEVWKYVSTQLATYVAEQGAA